MNRSSIAVIPRLALVAGCATVLGARPAHAQVAWTDWLAATTGTPGAASGVVDFGGTTVDVSYTGEVNSLSQTSCGTNYWNPSTPYESAAVSTPIRPCDIIVLTGGLGVTQTITFSRPVVNPFLAILSLGRRGTDVTYNFDAPFKILSFGPGYWGGPGTLIELSGNRLTGEEGHGVVQFEGEFTSISWTVPQSEFWHGFTVGASGLGDEGPPPTTVPEPMSMALLGTGLVGVAAARRRRKMSDEG